MESTQQNRLASLVYNVMLHMTPQLRNSSRLKLWQRAWRKCQSVFSGPVATVIHGYPAVVNYGNTYPVVSRLYPTYNGPLVELVYQAYQANNRPVTLIDVGAATGDTILLVQRNCPEMLKAFCCVDGDIEFLEYLRHNVGHFKEGMILNALLSSEEGQERSLVRIHHGTAIAQGETKVRSITLDKLIAGTGLPAVDVLKIDVDGFDGRVLLGSQDLLKNCKPAVIFEWSPASCKQTGNDLFTPFEVLERNGYVRLVFYTKFGEFSHYMTNYVPGCLDLLADLCLQSTVYDDWHYDIIALHDSSTISPKLLAELSYARNRSSHF